MNFDFHYSSLLLLFAYKHLFQICSSVLKIKSRTLHIKLPMSNPKASY
jgi:hypothetical protein